MKSHKENLSRKIVLAAAVMALAVSATFAGDHGTKSPVVPRNREYQDKTYEEWGASWWQWFLEQPIVSATGTTHPGIDDPHFDVTEGQHGDVWFLAATFGSDRTVTIPAGKALFIATLNAECSTLEAPPFYGGTANARRDCAKSYADMIDATTLFFTINGTAVNLAADRVASPDAKFNAPTPWIYGDTGGRGRTSGDGYYLLLEPLPPGHYDISFGGVFGAPPALAQTYHIDVAPDRHDGGCDQ